MSFQPQRQKLDATKPSQLFANRPQQQHLNHFEIVKKPFTTNITPTPAPQQNVIETMNDCESGCLDINGNIPKCQFLSQTSSPSPLSLSSSPLSPLSPLTSFQQISKIPAAFIDPNTLSMQDCVDALRGKVLEVEGNIGCGKSTLTKMIAKILNNTAQGIEDEVTVASLSKGDTTTTDIMNTVTGSLSNRNTPNKAATAGEYVPEVFAQLHGELVNQTFLSAFYANGQQYGFAFQMYMLTTRLFQMQTASFYAKNYGQFQLLDRGAVGDALFALYNASAGNISEEELNIYKSVCADRLPSSLSHRIDIVAFLDVSPLECYRRMNSMRQRDAEKEVVPDYLDGIDQAYFELMVKWLGSRNDSCGGINIGLPPPIVIFDWSEFGCAKQVVQKLGRAAISHNQQIEYLDSIQHQFNGQEELDQIRLTKNQKENFLIRPEVVFLRQDDMRAMNTVDLAAMTTIDIITEQQQVEEVYAVFQQKQVLIGRDGRKVDHLIIDWSLPHTNAFRRVVMKHIAREGKVTFINSDHDTLIM